MASGNPGTIAGVGPVIQPASGNVLPQGGNSAAATAVSGPANSGNSNAAVSNAALSNEAKGAASVSDLQTLVDQINKYLNDSGRPDEFRVDPDSDKYIQQVNPSTGAVVGKYLVSEFPALARSVGASSLLIDDRA